MHTSSSRRITGPGLLPTVLHREELVAALREVMLGPSSGSSGGPRWCKLVMICAPAGYGKTTLLADFERDTAMPCCWYFLTPQDADKITFLELLIASIRQRFPQFGASLDSLLAAAISATAGERAAYIDQCEAVIDMLAERIGAEIPERFALILSNYHEVNSNPDVNHLVNRLLQKLPPQCVIVIESRAMPSLEFAPLLARREMFGLGSNGLRFSVQEIRDLARLQGIEPLSEEEAQQLVASFDGWIAGILLGTRLGDLQFVSPGGTPTSFWGSPAMRMGRQNLFSYLANEVFNREPEVYAFLKGAAIFQQMLPSLCASLLDIPDAAERLDYLERQGLFVSRSGDGPQLAYRCHPVLRELLLEELRTQAPEQYASLHHRAAVLFHAARDYDSAIYHALEAQENEFAAALIAEAYEQEQTQGHTATLARWINALPAATVERYPRLLLARANIHLALGEYVSALPLLEKADQALSAQAEGIAEDEVPVLRAQIALARGSALFQAGEYAQAQALCHQVLAQLPPQQVRLRAEAHHRLGICSNMRGDFSTGILELQHALQLWQREGTVRQVAHLHSMLANAYGMLGKHTLSEHHRTRAIQCWESLNDEWGKVDNLIGLGVTKQRQGEFAAAEQVLTQALAIARGPIRFRRGEAYALVSLGDVYQDQGCYDHALSMIEDGLTLARQLKDTYLTDYALCSLAMTYLLMGDVQTAQLLVIGTGEEEPSQAVESYEVATRQLVLGTVRLYQCQYDEACALLKEVENALCTLGLTRERIQASIRRAACLHAQGEKSAAVRCLKEAAELASQHGYEQLASLELTRIPDLLKAVQGMPDIARLYHLPPQETGKQEHEAEPANPPVGTIPGSCPQETSRLQVQALGEPTVILDGVPITHWRMARAMELFFLLLDAGKPLHKEQILVALWPDEQHDQTLRSTVYYLRKVLGEASIIYRAGNYSLDLAPLYGNRVYYDVAVFQERYASAKELLAVEDHTGAEASLKEMVALYHGDFLRSFYSDWCMPRRDELRRIYIDARSRLAHLAWQREDFSECANQWQRLLALDRCLEEAHYGLMRCYLRQGKRGLALRQYQQCASVLHDELGVKPGPAIQNLYERITGNH
ncbi:MAG TPA: BTAD domain-containing putative transcriptional regulator [Ktedonobacteraceae bacterium]|nr:BTAD domain-containing putative transcriptional regulator [Ktedonobacteraceae bacterium]